VKWHSQLYHLVRHLDLRLRPFDLGFGKRDLAFRFLRDDGHFVHKKNKWMALSGLRLVAVVLHQSAAIERTQMEVSILTYLVNE
jgi:hypothetical protein